MMPLCGTFYYAGAVPYAKDDCKSRPWKLQDESGAAPRETGDELVDNRLIGLQPVLEISDSHLLLTASGRHRATIRSATLDLDPLLIGCLESGDVLALVRTGTADIGASVVRAGDLICAVGAVTRVPLGEAIRVEGGPKLEFSATKPRKDTWLDLSYSGETLRLRACDETTIGDYRISILQCFRDGIPGRYESVAISRRSMCPHYAAVGSASLLARPNAGLQMTMW